MLDFDPLTLLVVLGFALALATIMALIPFFIARARGHEHTGAILGLALGSLFFMPCWFAAMAWALTGKRPNRYGGHYRQAAIEPDPHAGRVEPTFKIETGNR